MKRVILNKVVNRMKLQDASVKEIKRIAAGSGICLAALLAAFFLLSRMGIGSFDYRVVRSGAVGTAVAIGNFALLCMTIQNAAGTDDKKKMKNRFQLSYNLRLIAQSTWVAAAFFLPYFHALAAAIPLLFPTAVIYYLQMKGKLVAPGRKDSPDSCEP